MRRLSRFAATLCLVAGVATLLTPGTVRATPPADRADPTMMRLLQRELESLRSTLEETYEEVARLREKAAASEAARAELEARLATLEAERERLAQVEVELAKLDERLDDGGASDFVDFHGHLLIRPEYVNNTLDFADAEGDEDMFYRQRIRIGATIRPLDWLRMRADLQYATIWGTDLATESGADSRLGFYQAFLELEVPWVPGLSLKAGRMELEYGAGRLVAVDDFVLSPRFFDGGVVAYEYEPYIRADLFGAVIRERSTPIGQDRNLFGLYLTTEALEGFTFDLYAIYMADGSPDSKRDVVTIGARAAGEPVEGLTFDAEAAVQVGSVGAPDGGTVDHLATGYFVAIDYEIPVWGRPTLGAFFSSASGDANPNDDRSVDFDPMFPDRHAYWGRLDLFTWSNIIDVGGRVRFHPLDDLRLLAEVHYFQMVEAHGRLSGLWGRQPADRSVEPALGVEVDLLVTYQIHRYIRLDLGYSLFLPDTAFDDVLGSSDRADWVYGQVRVDL